MYRTYCTPHIVFGITGNFAGEVNTYDYWSLRKTFESFHPECKIRRSNSRILFKLRPKNEEKINNIWINMEKSPYEYLNIDVKWPNR